MRIRCPHCGSLARSRTSRSLSQLVTEGYMDCSNVECGHRFKFLIEIVGSIVPSDTPNPTISLPLLKRKSVNQEG
ncbi:ogr/Delta-like zinc finger family protein [uncultured Tolumonas sp.]|uniref:ogr/Delta-like zinc finger family protein n=1 Tax=uncultured Tolumonas sp. TaxID=263765 RepID=UPI00292D70FC|nr:ogr/Delta-like zinc finger family protein [uncultured Tolumonas sp.]